MNTAYVQGQPTGYGELKPCILTGAGPASYSATGGDPIANPAAGDYIEFPSDCTTQSGNYSLTAIPTSAGYLRAGAPSPSASGWRWLWKYSGLQGVVSVVQNAAGSGMTVGTYPLVATGGGGSGFSGTLTVLTATTISIKINNAGEGYTSAPTITAPATGGTPPTFTVTVAAAAGNVAGATVLSAEIVQFAAVISQL